MFRLFAALAVAALLVLAIALLRSPTAPAAIPVQPSESVDAPATATGNSAHPTAANAPTAGERQRGALPTQGIRGRTVDPTGRPLGACDVTVFAARSMDPVAATTARQRGQSTPAIAACQSAADGTFALELPPLDSPDLTLHATAFGRTGVLHRLQLAAGAWRTVPDLVLTAGLEVRGVVRDRDHQRPIAGAAVTVTLPAEADLALPTRASALTARTDAEGRYAITGLGEGTFAIAAMAEGRARVELPGQLATLDEPNEIDFALAAGWTLRGIVVDALGHGIAGARVEGAVDGPEGNRIATFTGAGGTFTLDGLASGPALLTAAAARHALAQIGPIRAGTPDVRIVLVQRGSLRLRVRAADGQPLGAFVATARGVGDAGAALRRSGPVRARNELLHDGALLLPDLAAGDYTVEVEAPGHCKTLANRCTVADAAITDVEVTLQQGGRVRGRVLYGSGAAVAGARVLTESPQALGGEVVAALALLRGSALSTLTTTTERDGAFVFDHVAPGRYQLRIGDARFAELVVAGVDASEGGDFDVGTVVLPAGAQLSGRALVGGQVDLAVVVQVLALEGDLLPGTVLELPIGKDGTFKADRPLPAGRYVVMAGRRVAANPLVENADRQATRTEIELADGDVKTVDLAIRGQ